MAERGAEARMLDYGWGDGVPHTQAYLIRPLLCFLELGPGSGSRVLDLGCGNGALCDLLHQRGYRVVGVDPSPSGIAVAQRRHPTITFHQAVASAEELKALSLPPFDVVISTEVVKHCFSPRDWATAAFEALRPGGQLICSTPYHGYLKNLTLAASGRLDAHFTALWEGGHIKFWSRRSLSQLLQEAGFQDLHCRGAGRLPGMWKSMLMAGWKPL
ncbi:bifunctional 2-polyprenyl-6-hydroxyphenol methylase/3-demethylubiquinol 3-O-methyltransferase UbiG [Synechococcus sp. CS-1328]|uniref:class I SAM-dependent methyltransferase n=1 Tax=Synechococcus sp. CS-1328 TaxID=2847976 RepID=UPI00223C38DF|nr:class I SAM-dependent methyltransferase [Synechococcus sp. CS-1328]MCT0225926.1 class I SAM-dependent methyltransferase [Synechococcus sp. CS-1328]